MNNIILISNLEEVDLQRLLNRGRIPDELKQKIAGILNTVKARGLPAILEYTELFDGIDLTTETIRVDEVEIKLAYKKLNKNQLKSIPESIKRIKKFHFLQKRSIKNIIQKSKEGKTELRWLPLRRLGIYVPAGKAPLPSSLLMAAIPAQIAGVKEIIVCSPPQKDGIIDPSILVAANECGIKEVYKIGGAQAIASMAYGCELFKSVDLISGPGNIYVSYAKQLVSSEGAVKIDLIAGPTELIVLADETANSKFIASDMLAQAEHGINSSAICITTNEKLAEDVKSELENQLARLGNKQQIAQALQNFGGIFIAKGMSGAIDFVNMYSPEHVEVFSKNSASLAKKLVNAGAVFIQTGEVFGDYGLSGANHILPTGRSCKFSSGVSVYTFMKYQFVEKMSSSAQRKLARVTGEFAKIERLEAHSQSALMRGKNER